MPDRLVTARIYIYETDGLAPKMMELEILRSQSGVQLEPANRRLCMVKLASSKMTRADRCAATPSILAPPATHDLIVHFWLDYIQDVNLSKTRVKGCCM